MDFKQDILPLKNIIFRTALRIVISREEAEDIVQDCLLKIWKQIQQGEKILNLESYTLTMARNLALDRKALASTKVLSLNEQVHDHEDEHQLMPDEALIHNEGTSIIETLVDRLPEKQRTIIQLRDVEGKSYKDIAQVLGISESDVKAVSELTGFFGFSGTPSLMTCFADVMMDAPPSLSFSSPLSNSLMASSSFLPTEAYADAKSCTLSIIDCAAAIICC